MGCRCQERRDQIASAVSLIEAGDIRSAAAKLREASRTLGEDGARFIAAAPRRLAAAHARLRR